VAPGELITIEREGLNRFCQQEPDLGIHLLWKLVARVGGQLKQMSSS